MWTCLVCDNGTGGRSGVSSDNDATVKDTADDGGSGAGGFGQRDAFGMEGSVAVVVGEVEARHGGGTGRE